MEKEDVALKATRDNVTQTTATTTLSAFPHVKQKNLKIPPEEQQLHDFNLRLQWTWTEIKNQAPWILKIPHQHDRLNDGF